MQLRRLDLHGFKTFANPLSLDFSSGISAIVGPNGSGKSNVADAILWALGEQNVRTLRGGKLQDVIFAGSSTRRPTGMAEVSLTFDNQSRALPLDYAEVTVTRRVYRSDESEYFINRTPCRLRDIVELFLDTGIGRESYFALNQGEIDMVLSANPEERRLLFEEAAGIKKYRLRKRESLRKLETTEANLVRIHDLMAEIQARIGPLERQSEAAKQYQELRERLQVAEWGAFAADWSILRQRMHENLNSLEEARTATIAADVELSRLAAEEAAERLKLHGADEALERAHRSHESLVAETAQTEGRIRVLQERIRSEAVAAERTQQRLADLSLQKHEMGNSLSSVQNDMRAAEITLQQLQQDLAGARQKLSEKEMELRRADSAVQEAQKAAVEQAARDARQGAERESAKRRLENIRAQLAGLETRSQDLKSRRAALVDRREHVRQQRQSTAEKVDSHNQAINDLAGQGQGLREALKTIVDEVRSQESNLASQSSRLRVLEELQDARDGFYKGVKAILVGQQSGKLSGHYRVVADLITIRPEHEAALEAALGSSVQDIITRTDQEARDGIRYLKQTGSGRATFLSLELVARLSRGGARAYAHGSGVLGSALDLVDFHEDYRPVMEMLLGRSVVCDTLENGNTAARRLQQWSRIVTLEGDVISSQGAMTGGSRQVGRGSSIVGRSSQITALRTEIAADHTKLQEMQERRTEFEREIGALREKQTVVEQARQALLTEDAQYRRDQEYLAQEEGRLDREGLSLQSEREKAQSQEARDEENLQRLLTPRIDHSTSSGSEPVQALQERASRAAVERDQAREILSGLQSQEAVSAERRKTLAASIEDLRRRLDRVHSEERTLEAQRNGAQDQANHAEIESLLQSSDTIAAALRHAQEQIELAREERETITAKLESIGSANRELNRSHQERSHALYLLEAARSGLERDRQRIREVLAEDYGVGVVDSAPDQSSGTLLIPGLEDAGGHSTPDATAKDSTAAEAETDKDSTAATETVLVSASIEDRSPGAVPATESDANAAERDPVEEFLACITPSANPDRDRQLANRLRRQMRALEPVNLGAIVEAAEVQERFEFLTTQRADVESAAQDLRAVIRKIDIEARERFLKTFSAIAIHFDELFRQLFGGGQTRLALTDPDEPTESGIEISAQPPGKKLQNLSLLSGGERSLTAVALLFAMLRVRPVPFCIMDEVDAALDEANIGRFGQMVREFAAATQFIIITHNRGTMEVADRLYGVTMSEPGVSRVLSVQLGELETHASNHNHLQEAAVG